MPPSSNDPMNFLPNREWTGQRGVTISFAALLILLGLLLLAFQVLGGNAWGLGWPALIFLPGVALLGIAMNSRGAIGLAIPGMILTTTGLILFVQNMFDIWQTWAYAWALVAPTSVGVALWLMGILSDDEALRSRGAGLAGIGLALFIAFFVFFEGLINMSGFVPGSLVGVVLPLVLIAIGAILLFARRR